MKRRSHRFQLILSVASLLGFLGACQTPEMSRFQLQVAGEGHGFVFVCDTLPTLRERLIAWLTRPGGQVLAENRMLTQTGLAELAALGYATGAVAPPEDEPWYVPPKETAARENEK